MNLTTGDRITWNFPASEGQPHDVWVVAPGGNPDPAGPDLAQVTSGIVFPGGPSVTKTFTQNGDVDVLLQPARVVQRAARGAAWSARPTWPPATAGDPPSGVDFTEYRVKTGDAQGDWVRKTNTGGANPFASQVTVSAEGQHTVEYRSVDKAGNVEATKTVAFGIDIPDPGFPVIQAFADPTSGTAPLLVRFSATGFDPDGGTLSYKWEFADGTALGARRRADVHQPGTYTGKVTATDDEGDTTSKDVTVTVTAPDVGPADGRGDVRRRRRGPAPLKRAVHRRRQRPGRPGGRPALHVGLRRRRHVARRRTRPTRTSTPGTYTAKVTVTDGSRRDAPPTRSRSWSPTRRATGPPTRRGRRAAGVRRRAPLEVLLTADGTRPGRRRRSRTRGTSTTARRAARSSR